MKLALRVTSVVGLLFLVGCATQGTISTACTTNWTLTVTPTVATTSHSAQAPVNQVQFTGLYQPEPAAGCATPALTQKQYASWTNPDPINIQISSANDATNGTAVCKGTTNGAVTLTGVFSPILPNGPAGGGTPQTTETVKLTCQ